MTDSPEHSLEREIIGDPTKPDSKFRVRCKCGWHRSTKLKHRERVDKKAFTHFYVGNLNNTLGINRLRKQKGTSMDNEQFATTDQPQNADDNDAPNAGSELGGGGDLTTDEIENGSETTNETVNGGGHSVGDQVHESDTAIGGGGVRRDGVVIATHDATGDEGSKPAVTVGWFAEVTRVDADTVTSGASVEHEES